MKKRRLSLLLTLSMVVSFFPGMTLTASAANIEVPTCPHTSSAGHEGWTELTESGRLSGGNYYLTGDLTVEGGITVSGTVTLCLSGHTLNMNGNSIGLSGQDGHLVLCSCGNNRGTVTGAGGNGVVSTTYYTTKLDVFNVNFTNSTGSQIFKAGYVNFVNCDITGNTATGGPVIDVGRKVALYNVVMSGNQATHQNNSSVYDYKYDQPIIKTPTGSTLHLYNTTIRNNTCGTYTLTEESAAATAKVYIDGKVIIADNKNFADKSKNVYLQYGLSRRFVTAGLTEGSLIYVDADEDSNEKGIIIESVDQVNSAIDGSYTDYIKSEEGKDIIFDHGYTMSYDRKSYRVDLCDGKLIDTFVADADGGRFENQNSTQSVYQSKYRYSKNSVYTQPNGAGTCVENKEDHGRYYQLWSTYYSNTDETRYVVTTPLNTGTMNQSMFNSEGKNGVTWDPSAYTLTLDGAVINVAESGKSAITVPAGKTLKINVVGENTSKIIGDLNGISGNVEIVGEAAQNLEVIGVNGAGIDGNVTINPASGTKLYVSGYTGALTKEIPNEDGTILMTGDAAFEKAMASVTGEVTWNEGYKVGEAVAKTMVLYYSGTAYFDPCYSGADVIEVEHKNGVITAPDNVTFPEDKYTLEGWYTGLFGTGTKLEGSARPGQTYYAKWVDGEGKLVITKPLDFVNNAANLPAETETYTYANNKLTLNNLIVDAAPTKVTSKFYAAVVYQGALELAEGSENKISVMEMNAAESMPDIVSGLHCTSRVDIMGNGKLSVEGGKFTLNNTSSGAISAGISSQYYTLGLQNGVTLIAQGGEAVGKITDDESSNKPTLISTGLYFESSGPEAAAGSKLTAIGGTAYYLIGDEGTKSYYVGEKTSSSYGIYRGTCTTNGTAEVTLKGGEAYTSGGACNAYFTINGNGVVIQPGWSGAANKVALTNSKMKSGSAIITNAQDAESNKATFLTTTAATLSFIDAAKNVEIFLGPALTVTASNSVNYAPENAEANNYNITVRTDRWKDDEGIEVTTGTVNISIRNADGSFTKELGTIDLAGEKTLAANISGIPVGSYTVVATTNSPSSVITEPIQATTNVTIRQLNASSFTIIVNAPEGGYIYDGTAKEPIDLTFKNGEDVVVLIPEVDYEITGYTNNMNAGENTAKVNVKYKGNYSGTGTGTFSIAKKTVTVSAADIKDIPTQEQKNNETITISQLELQDGTVLKVNVDYTAEYANNTAPGTAAMTITLKDTNNIDFTSDGDLVKNFEIKKALSVCTITLEQPEQAYTYTGEPHTPVVTVKDGETVLEMGKDYTVEYSANTDAGTATITITGVETGDYTGTVEKTFTIAKANQEAPDATKLKVVNHETVKNKKDGSISGVTEDMEYSKDGGDWTAANYGDKLIGNKLTGLAPGDYVFRYQENNNYNASPVTNEPVTIKASDVTLTVKFDLNGAAGDAIADVTDIECGATISAPTPAPTRDGYVFDGWCQTANGKGKWDFTEDTVTDNMTLYAKWTQLLNTVGGMVQEYDQNDQLLPAANATVKLMKNGEQKGTTQTDSEGNYSFGDVAVGTYNIVVTKGNETVTVLVNVTANTAVKPIIMPNGDKTSTVDNSSAGAFKADVGGLDEIANAQELAHDSDKIVIKLTVTDPVSVNQDAADAIAEKAGEKKTLEYVDLALTKSVNGGASQDIGDQNDQLLTIIIPFDTYYKHDFAVYRYHGGAAQVLTTTPVNGEYIVVGTDTITIYAKKFSTYAIGYTVGEGTTPNPPSNPGYTGGGSYTPTYTVTVPKTENGKVTATPKTASNGSTVKINVTPDEGYELDTLTVTDKNGKAIAVTDLGNGTYSFKMPSGNVTVQATFRAVTEAGCPKDETCPIWPYLDASTTAWYHDGAHYCIENGLMSGLPGQLFAPNGTTTRAQIVTILWNLEGTPVEDYTMSFADVAAGQWYTEAVRWAAANGVVTGLSDEIFAPNAAITREQLVTILRNYAQYKQIDVSEETNILSYTDARSVSAWAMPAIQWACASGVISGLPDGNALKLDPQGTATRAQVATMMMNFCENIVK